MILLELGLQVDIVILLKIVQLTKQELLVSVFKQAVILIYKVIANIVCMKMIVFGFHLEIVYLTLQTVVK